MPKYTSRLWWIVCARATAATARGSSGSSSSIDANRPGSVKRLSIERLP
jgi:hypothetical protein